MTDLTLSWQHDGMRPTAYRRNARGLRDRQAFEGVRMQAGALFAAGRSHAQVAAIDQALRQGARAHGFDTDHWTLARITTLIQWLTGVGYHPGHVWKLLHHRLHYRLQRPARRAIERDEQAIARWVANDWP